MKRELGRSNSNVSGFSAAEFLEARLKGVGLSEFDDAAKRAFIDLLRSDCPLTSNMRNLLAVTLEELIFPQPKEVVTRRRNEFHATLYKEAIELLATKLKGRPGAKTRAEERFAKSVGLSVDALRQRIKRGSRTKKL